MLRMRLFARLYSSHKPVSLISIWASSKETSFLRYIYVPDANGKRFWTKGTASLSTMLRHVLNMTRAAFCMDYIDKCDTESFLYIKFVGPASILYLSDGCSNVY